MSEANRETIEIQSIRNISDVEGGQPAKTAKTFIVKDKIAFFFEYADAAGVTEIHLQQATGVYFYSHEPVEEFKRRFEQAEPG